MTGRPFSFALFALMLVAQHAPSTLRASQAGPPLDHAAWVANVLARMETIKPGMTRKDLLVVFRTEGGLSTGLRRTFVSRDCSYFKVDVQFEAVGRPDRDPDGGVTLNEDARDVVTQISKPYLQRPITN